MAKSKGPRINITLECTMCKENNLIRSTGISRYLTSKNKRNNSEKLQLSKYCKYCNYHTIHKEIK
jgi:large subunit ribosomal protein L33